MTLHAHTYSLLPTLLNPTLPCSLIMLDSVLSLHLQEQCQSERQVFFPATCFRMGCPLKYPAPAAWYCSLMMTFMIVSQYNR